MPKGKIKFINFEKKFGFIAKDDGGELHFKLQVVRKPTRWEDLQQGMEVKFEVMQGERGPTASWVALAGSQTISAQIHSPVQKQAQAGASALPSVNNRNFLNPYNFVRWLTPRDAQDAEPPEVRLMGHCPPPPHDRWVGLSGIIHCKAVAETPVFVADAENVTQDKGEPKHRHYHFFTYGEKEAIPATSLRGPIRSMFEAATNSCFSNLTDKRLSYHLEATDAPKLVPARVAYDEQNGSWRLQLLTGTTPLRSVEQVPDPQYAAWMHRYWPLEPSDTLDPDPTKVRKYPMKEDLRKRTSAFRNSRAKGAEKEIDGFKHGDECFALLQEFAHPHPRIKFWDVLEVSNDASALKMKIHDPRAQRVEKGWLCFNNQNIESKHSERFFFRAADNRTGPREIDLPENVRNDYEALIQDYRERHGKEVDERREARGPGHDHEPWPGKKKMEAALSRFVYRLEEKKLRGGELVYARLAGSAQAPEVKFIVPVSVPRVMYDHSIAQRLPHERLQRCIDPEVLCPACRTFGWVRGERNEEGAYASRVSFSHAIATNPIKMKSEILLAILSSPKPTTTRFYLIHASWQSHRRNAKLAGYDHDRNVLRGRKFYRHFGAKLSSTEYTRATDAQHNGKDDQNRTIHGVLDKGSEFTFTVRFENLAPAELGALLWSLEMDGRGFHRLGLAKPLGFGSVRLRIDESKGAGLQLLDPADRYRADALTLPPYRPIAGNKRHDYVTAFKRAMVRGYAPDRAKSIDEENDGAWAAAFERLDNIADLRAMLNEPPPDLAIHYPRLDPEPLPEGENFKWFMSNNREAGRKAGLLLELEVPAEEVENARGLPLNPMNS